ncbi:MAG: CoA-binding protein [Bryobacterales bacterium]|nr:CoA-binding protein [Bryobacterales bacterium]
MADELEILKSCRTIAVVGLSANKFRPSYDVAAYMQRAGYRIVPVNPGQSEILGEKCYARLEDIPEPVDCVNVFRQVEYVPAIMEAAIAIGAKAVWLQLDIVDDAAAEKGRAAGLMVVQDRCLLIEHRRYRGELGG